MIRKTQESVEIFCMSVFSSQNVEGDVMLQGSVKERALPV